MLQDVYERLVWQRLAPQWVDGELRVDVHGRPFALTDYPGGVAVRTFALSTPVIFRHPDDAIVALGVV